MIGGSLQRLLMCLPEGDCTDLHRARSIVHSRNDLRYRSHEEVQLLDARTTRYHCGLARYRLGLGGVPKIAKNAKEPGAQIRSQLGTLRGLDVFAGRSNTCGPIIHGLADYPR
jgi:hypothetical protein